MIQKQLTEETRSKLYYLAGFIRGLKPEKLNMDIVAEMAPVEGRPYDPKIDMDPIQCTSAGCGMGWGPFVFPDDLEYVMNDQSTIDDDVRLARHLDVRCKENHNLINYAAMAYTLGISRADAASLFRDANEGFYETPDQVADALLEYADTGLIPRCCFDDDDEYKEYLSDRTAIQYERYETEEI